MPAVKGSKQVKMIVVPYQPWRAVWIRLCLLAVILAVGAGAYLFGHKQGVAVNGDARIDRDRYKELVADLRAQNADLNQQILNLEQAGDVDKQALSNVQDTILSLREKNSQLEEDVLFYKQIMSPDNQETGLVIGQLDLLKTDKPLNIHYKLELKQQGNNENVITGHANVNILGLQDDKEVSIPLRSLSDSEKSLDIRLQFRYFQNIEGVLVLPENFEPQKVQIIAVAEGKNGKTVQKSFGWLVEN